MGILGRRGWDLGRNLYGSPMNVKARMQGRKVGKSTQEEVKPWGEKCCWGPGLECHQDPERDVVENLENCIVGGTRSGESRGLGMEHARHERMQARIQKNRKH